MSPNPVIYDAITVKPHAGFAFDLWYTEHYLPAAMAAGPFARVRSYGGPGSNTYLSVFEVHGDPGVALGTLPEPLHERVASTIRFAGAPISAKQRPDVRGDLAELPYLYAVFFPVPREWEADFEKWYEHEHVDMLLACPQWGGCRRFRFIGGPGADGHTHVAVHYLRDLRALRSPERDAARDTPQRDRLAAQPWFRGSYNLFYRLPVRLGLEV